MSNLFTILNANSFKVYSVFDIFGFSNNSKDGFSNTSGCRSLVAWRFNKTRQGFVRAVRSDRPLLPLSVSGTVKTFNYR